MKDKISGMVGWREFLQNRQEILNKVDSCKQKTWNRPVKVAHGNVAEAAVRVWLTNFLPKKYGVTSGYVIPNIYNDVDKIFHYDIIIYEQLEAPILWIESNDDDSTLGRKLAIPAKYVRAIYEVKSTLNKKNATEAYNKLKEINAIKDHLGLHFNSGAIFIDLPSAGLNDKKILPALLHGHDVYGCWGGVVLRSNVDELATGLISFFKADAEFEKYNDIQIPLCVPIDSVDVKITEEGNARLGGEARFTSDGNKTWYITKFYRVHYALSDVGVELTWSRSGFSDFAIQILSEIEGLKENDSDRKKFGMVYELLEREEIPLQPVIKEDGSPYVNISLRKYDQTNSFIRIEKQAEESTLYIKFEVENTGAVEVDITADGFVNFATLDLGSIRSMELSFSLKHKKGKSLDELLKRINDETHPFKLEKRFAYRYKSQDGTVNFFAVIAAFEVFLSKYSIVQPKTIN